MREIGDEVIELAQHQRMSMVSSWTEYLTLSRGAHKKYLLAHACHEALAEESDYFNQEKDDYELPEEINGEPVWVEDGCLVSGRLIINMDDMGLEFDDPSEPEVAAWLNDFGWTENVSVTDLKRAIRWGGSQK
jgi:hypothetical protein